MVAVRYLGTGEAFDEKRPNMSFILETKTQRLLFDCGYSIPHQLWSVSTAPAYLDGIYISHFHADHCFGLPALVARLGQDGRRAPLRIVGGPGSQVAATNVLEMGYPGILKKTPFSLDFIEIEPGAERSFGGWVMSTARSYHSRPNYSVRVTADGFVVCYSGDGAPSTSCRQLYQRADLLIHEAYYPNATGKRSHASLGEVLTLASDVAAQQLHLVHLSRKVARPTDLVIPEAGEHFLLSR